jgi:hypothetical protein
MLYEHARRGGEGITPDRKCENDAMCGLYVSPDEASIEREFNLVHQE